MPRNHKRKHGARVYTRPPLDVLKKAYKEWKQGTSQRRVCDEHQLTRSVFQRYIKKREDKKTLKAPGGQTVLSLKTEKALVTQLLQLSEWGFPFGIMDLRMTVKSLLDKKGTVIPKFHNNLPGEDWAYCFKKRHEGKIGKCLSQKSTSVCSETVVTSYFEKLKQTIQGVPPTNIINYDELNLTEDLEREQMVLKRDTRYPGSTNISTSVMLAGTAAGKVLPLYVVYKADHILDTWTEGGPDEAEYNRSKSGWFDSVCFEDWFRTIALPYCRNLTGKKLLIGDNLSSHFTDEIMLECTSNNIAFICLPPDSTHLYQPLQKAFFAPFKRRWRTILTTFKRSTTENAGKVSNNMFPKLLRQLMLDIPKQQENLTAGFRKCLTRRL